MKAPNKPDQKEEAHPSPVFLKHVERTLDYCLSLDISNPVQIAYPNEVEQYHWKQGENGEVIFPDTSSFIATALRCFVRGIYYLSEEMGYMVASGNAVTIEEFRKKIHEMEEKLAAIDLIEAIKEVTRAAKTMSELLSEIDGLKISTAKYLKRKYPKRSITPNNLHRLPEDIKDDGRMFLKQKLGEGLQTPNQIKEVFRKPRKSKSHS